jgi:4-hydroxymandelate oxidase
MEFSTNMTEDELATCINLDDFEAPARARMSKMAYEYLASGSADEITLAANREAFAKIKLLPRYLIDVSRIDTSLELFGRRHEFPVLLAPTGYHKLFHPQGELETVRGADTSEATLVASIFSTVSFEQMAAVSKQPLWLQIYVNPDRGFTKQLVDMAVSAGCGAICVTIDSPVNGPRDRETRAVFQLPEGIERANLSTLGSGIAAASHRRVGRNIYSKVRAADVTWKDVEWLRSLSPVPLLLKGILNPADAITAINAGCDGIIVSNHGGRVLDTVPAALEALPAVVDRIGGKVPVLLDGGIRRGADAYKALALGATAVLIGRPYLYGLALAGASGVARAVEIIRTELEMTMALMGRPSLAAIGPDSLWGGKASD